MIAQALIFSVFFAKNSYLNAIESPNINEHVAWVLENTFLSDDKGCSFLAGLQPCKLQLC